MGVAVAPSLKVGADSRCWVSTPDSNLCPARRHSPVRVREAPTPKGPARGYWVAWSRRATFADAWVARSRNLTAAMEQCPPPAPAFRWAVAAIAVLSLCVAACSASSVPAAESRARRKPVCAYVTLGDARRILGRAATGDQHGVPPTLGCFYSLRDPAITVTDTAGQVKTTRVTKILAVQVLPRGPRPGHPTPGQLVDVPRASSPGHWEPAPSSLGGVKIGGGVLSVTVNEAVIEVSVINTGHDLAIATQLATHVARQIG